MSSNIFTIHIGPHKTGTTYIQKCLVKNRSKLLDAGVFYPEIGQETLYGHHEFVKSIAQKDDPEISRLLESIPPIAKRTLLSSENFSSLAAGDIEYLASKLQEYTVEIVFFLRDPEPLLSSNWQESVKHGAVISWSEYFLNHLTHPFRSEIINPSLILDKYARVFGDESIRIIDYEEIVQKNGDVAVALSRLVDADIDTDSAGERINKSMHSSVTEVLRVLNQKFANENKLYNSNVRQAFFTVTEEITAKPKVAKLLGIVANYQVHYTLSGSAIIPMVENQVLKKYGREGLFGRSVSGRSYGGNFPTSGWVCDTEGAELLAWLKKRVEAKLSWKEPV